ncbi:MAG: RagB/SusD family nutrient uptake outer membrane protein [Bacteroidales bacterium]|jgi:hypothetical protein|nr:RagB/SusD family nutrient uptake outer membrane protein [Bacteroidales bacterium]
MKSNFFSVLATVAITSSVALVSCDDGSDGGKNVISGKSTWQTDQEALASANAIYPPLQRLSSSYSFLLESATENTISFEGADDADGPLVSLFETDVNNWYPTKIFNYLYVSIGEANRTIEKSDSSYASANLSQQAIDLAKARAKFVRGLNYLYLTNLWGEVPLILTTNASAAERTGRKTIDEVYNQIVKDLTDAEAALPAFDQIRSNPSKGAANAILSRTYLQWASKPLSQTEVAAIATSKSDPAAPVWDRDKLNKAVEYANKVIESGNYQLETDYGNLWGVRAENRSVEHIFTIHHDGDNNGDAQGNHQTHCPFTFRFELYTDNHIGPADVTILNRFSNSDKRKDYSIITYLYNGDERVTTGSATKAEDYKRYDYVYPVTSPRNAKFIHRNADLYNVAPGTSAGQPNNINRIEIRLAEVLLIKAEALFYLDKKSEAVQVINQLRQRAGLNTYSSLTQEQLENEWYLELYFEQRHWVNLTRWRKLVKTVLDVTPTFEYYKGDYKTVASQVASFGPENDGTDGVKTNYPFFAKIYKHLHAKTDNVTGKLYRFPIPKGLNENDLGIGQNPGY